MRKHTSLTVSDDVKVSDDDLFKVMCKADDLCVVLEVIVGECESVDHHRSLYKRVLKHSNEPEDFA